MAEEFQVFAVFAYVYRTRQTTTPKVFFMDSPVDFSNTNIPASPLRALATTFIYSGGEVPIGILGKGDYFPCSVALGVFVVVFALAVGHGFCPWVVLVACWFCWPCGFIWVRVRASFRVEEVAFFSHWDIQGSAHGLGHAECATEMSMGFMVDCTAIPHPCVLRVGDGF